MSSLSGALHWRGFKLTTAFIAAGPESLVLESMTACEELRGLHTRRVIQDHADMDHRPATGDGWKTSETLTNPATAALFGRLLVNQRSSGP